MRSTYTYAILDVSRECYQEIRAKLEAAGYQQAFHQDGAHTVIDMRGIALRMERLEEREKRLRTLADDPYACGMELFDADLFREARVALAFWMNEAQCRADARAQQWLPTADAINALPEPLRRYIHDLETKCDPAGDLRELALARDTIRYLEAKVCEALDHEGEARVALAEVQQERDEAVRAFTQLDKGCNIPAQIAFSHTLDRAERAEALVRQIVGLVQRLQPTGSPPPGDALVLVGWIVESVQAQLREAEARLTKQAEAQARG